MKILEVDDNIIDFQKVQKDKLLKDLPTSFSNAFAIQEEVEQHVRNKLKQFELESRGQDAKFKIPTILSDYSKGIYPLDAWGFQIYRAMSGDLNEKIAKFVINKAKDYLSELIQISEEDIKNAESLLPLAEKTKAPEYVERIIFGQSGGYRNNLGTFKKFHDLIQQGKTTWTHG